MNTNIMELPDCEHLLSRKLQTAGYRCGYTGKWHLGTDKTRRFLYPWKPSLPKDVGFDGQNFPGHGGGGFYYPEYHEHQCRFGHDSGLQLRTDKRLCEGRVPRFGEILQEMRRRLDVWMEDSGDPFRWKGYLPYVLRRGFRPD